MVRNSASNIYSVPRRFDVATMMSVTLAYALLFGALRLVQIPPTGIVIVAGFFTCVGIGQAALFRSQKPRLASVLLGVLYFVVVHLVHAVTEDRSLLRYHVLVFVAWLIVAFSGAISGYLAGVTVGAVFLVSDAMRRFMQRWSSH